MLKSPAIMTMSRLLTFFTMDSIALYKSYLICGFSSDEHSVGA